MFVMLDNLSNTVSENIAGAPSSESWSIAETASYFGITPRTLRFYEDKGLLRPSRNGGRRMYSLVDRARVERILRAKRIGFALEDIKEFLDVADGRVRDLPDLRARRENFLQVIERLKRKKHDLAQTVKDMQDLCTLIEDHLQSQNSIQSMAKAYQARLAEYMDKI